jgi:hypothetical protein
MTNMDPQSSPPAGPRAAPWHKVVLDTIRLSRQRRREHRDDFTASQRSRRADPQRSRRAWIAVLIVAAGLLSGALLATVALIGPDDPTSGGTAAPPTSPLVDTSALPSRPTTESSRAGPDRTASLGRAAAGSEIAERTDIDVSPAAGAILREGAVDGRVLIVLAALATEGYLTAVDVTPAASGGTPELELGVADVDVVLDWLDEQPRVRPDHLQVRRQSSVAYLQLTYRTPEPAGLFPF